MPTLLFKYIIIGNTGERSVDASRQRLAGRCLLFFRAGRELLRAGLGLGKNNTCRGYGMYTE